MRRALLLAGLLSAVLPAGCASPDPKQGVELLDLECYWAVDSSVGDRHYIAPVARFRLRNKQDQPLRAVQATATFRRKGEENVDWGTAWAQVTPARKPLLPGQAVLVVLKSDGRYYSTGAPESFFENKLFKDAHTTVYVRVGSSQWVKFAEADVERRIGTKSLEDEPR